jgi:murein DD-endopeptidase MepM/ murein hydrolase activator NlpD
VIHATTGCHPTDSWSCGGGFGNYVTVAHDGGLATVYAHLSAVHVGAGTAVSAGQSLGAVGNSGNSYGPHLHFEIREAGVARNPCGYISC